MTREDCEYAESRAFVIGVNDAYRIARCDVLYASDYHWWQHHWEAVKDLPLLRVTQHSNAEDKCPLPIFAVRGSSGRNLTSRELTFGGNSGFAALHLAILWGAAKVLLLGYDLSRLGDQKHWFGDHPGMMNMNSCYQSFIRSFEDSPKPPIPIINCSRRTALGCFPRSTIQAEL